MLQRCSEKSISKFIPLIIPAQILYMIWAGIEKSKNSLYFKRIFLSFLKKTLIFKIFIDYYII